MRNLAARIGSHRLWNAWIWAFFGDGGGEREKRIERGNLGGYIDVRGGNGRAVVGRRGVVKRVRERDGG